MPDQYFRSFGWIIFILVILAVAGCNPAQAVAETTEQPVEFTAVPQPASERVEFTLKTAAQDGRLLYIGVGGQIDGQINPNLEVTAGDVVTIILINGDGMKHDVSLPDFDVTSAPVFSLGDQTELTFDVEQDSIGSFAYFCTVPGHRQLGQEGTFIVRER